MAGDASDAENRLDLPFSCLIVLSIKSQDGDEAFFRVARDKKIQQLLKSYCKGKNFIFREMEFLHNGVRIQTTKTLAQLGIKDGDQIDAMEHHGGGGNLRIFA